ncbi:cytochrome P450 [Xylaria bambusicola]|uniref:cytochrome P450 n=1 Tax=Xylaria bambusicola TaxID=326684 RepID=UPI0020087744|nr:cytochrome P450 [Xylaria bambusicola]KAI0521295.1 cytochrome P450 [Xylaria bambusicola]
MSLIPFLDASGKLGWTQAALSAAGLTFTWYIVSSVVAWYKLRHIPGPFLASFNNIWGFWAICTGQSNQIIADAQKKYGRVMRVAPDAISTFDPETLFRIISPRSNYLRSQWYTNARFDHRGDSVFTMTNTPSHNKRKAKLAPAFSGKNVPFLETKLDKWLTALIKTIRDRIAKGEETIEIGLLIEHFQLDLISELSMGQPWGNLQANEDHFGYLEMRKTVIPSIQSWLHIPLARKIFMSSVFLKLFAPRTTDTKGLGLFLGVLEDAVKRRFSVTPEKAPREQDILDIWIEHGHSARECQLDLAILVPAGSDTTIMMIRGTLLLLMSTPAVYWKLKQEIRDAISDGRISSPVTNEEAKSLEYTQAVVREGFRIMMPVNYGFPKQVPDSGDTICGIPIPGGTDVYVNYESLMRCEEVFGKDADIFRPERFLGSGPDVAYKVKVLDLAFGGGYFTCLGKTLAVIEMNKVFVELFRNFNFQTANPEKPWRREVYTTWLVHDFWTRVTEDTTMG